MRTMVTVTRFYFVFFGVLVIVGGLVRSGSGSSKNVASLVAGEIGYAKAGSPYSIAGVFSGLLLFAGAYLLAKHLHWGLAIAGCVSLAWATRFFINLAAVEEAVPAWWMFLLSVLGVLMTGFAWITQ